MARTFDTNVFYLFLFLTPPPRSPLRTRRLSVYALLPCTNTRARKHRGGKKHKNRNRAPPPKPLARPPPPAEATPPLALHDAVPGVQNKAALTERRRLGTVPDQQGGRGDEKDGRRCAQDGSIVTACSSSSSSSSASSSSSSSSSASPSAPQLAKNANAVMTSSLHELEQSVALGFSPTTGALANDATVDTKEGSGVSPTPHRGVAVEEADFDGEKAACFTCAGLEEDADVGNLTEMGLEENEEDRGSQGQEACVASEPADGCSCPAVEDGVREALQEKLLHRPSVQASFYRVFLLLQEAKEAGRRALY